MNSDLNEDSLQNATPEEIMSALFANMIIQQANMAMIFLGKVPHPETGEAVVDLEAAKMFIDQIEMLEFKTKGNITPAESALMKQSLTALRMEFVAAIENQGESPEQSPSQPLMRSQAPSEQAEAGAPAPAGAGSAPTEDTEDSRKKFSKKY